MTKKTLCGQLASMFLQMSTLFFELSTERRGEATRSGGKVY